MHRIGAGRTSQLSNTFIHQFIFCICLFGNSGSQRWVQLTQLSHWAFKKKKKTLCRKLSNNQLIKCSCCFFIWFCTCKTSQISENRAQLGHSKLYWRKAPPKKKQGACFVYFIALMFSTQTTSAKSLAGRRLICLMQHFLIRPPAATRSGMFTSTF